MKTTALEVNLGHPELGRGFIVLEHVTGFIVDSDGLHFSIHGQPFSGEGITDETFVTDFLNYFGQVEIAEAMFA